MTASDDSRTPADFADGVLRATDLDDETADDVRPVLEGWFSRWEDQIRAMERGEDDGCPCESCQAAREGRA